MGEGVADEGAFAQEGEAADGGGAGAENDAADEYVDDVDAGEGEELEPRRQAFLGSPGGGLGEGGRRDKGERGGDGGDAALATHGACSSPFRAGVPRLR